MTSYDNTTRAAESSLIPIVLSISPTHPYMDNQRCYGADKMVDFLGGVLDLRWLFEVDSVGGAKRV